MRLVFTAGAIALIALTTSACGRMGELERPSARESERARRGADAPNLPDPATLNRPATQVPIDGGASNPFSGSGAYPNGPGGA